MTQTMTHRKRLATVALIALFGTAFLTGCGGSNSSSSTNSGDVVTRATEATYSQDAKLLTAREASGPWLPTDLATRFDADLKKVSDAFPQVAEIDIYPEASLRDVLIEVPATAPWIDRWKSGQITTGESKLDDVLTKYSPASVESEPLLDSEGSSWFIIHFEQSLNIKSLTTELAAASTNIKNAEPNNQMGDGDNIRYSAGEDGARLYTFSQGWGDCPSGCTSRHTWKFAVTGDGVELLEESGTPLP